MKTTPLPGGHTLCHDARAVIIRLKGSCRVLSTSYLNGGIREDIRCLFNFCDIYDSPDDRCEMRAPTNEGHLVSIAEELGLPPELTTGLSTAAHMRHVSPRTESYRDFSVTAIATAGIDVNGSRAGDPAFWHEKDGVPFLEKPGTINIYLLIDAHLTAGALARALVTCSEAKTAALQEVLAPSLYSSGPATGSGTDGTIIVSNTGSPTRLTCAGHYSKLGEYIGRVVKAAVKESLVAENGFKNYARGSVLRNLKRFGLNSEKLLAAYGEVYKTRGKGTAGGSFPGGALPAPEEMDFPTALKRLDSNDGLIARAAVFAHLLDLLQWNLIDPEDAVQIAESMLAGIADILKIPPPSCRIEKSENGAASRELLDCLARTLAAGITP